jgi:TRAP transporter TAXI family solute receptor
MRLAALLAALTAAGCARGADQARLQADIQDKLNNEVKGGLFDVVAIRREGSAPLPPSAGGDPRLIVYFNATLRLKDDYEFDGWDQLGASSLAYALGASEKGVSGLSHENHIGDLVRVHGSAIYQQAATGWSISPVEPPRAVTAPHMEGTSPPSRSKLLIDQIAAMVDGPPPGVTASQDEIIAQELQVASENIKRRFERARHRFTLATGPGGEYTRIGAAIIDDVKDAAPAIQLRARPTAGSVENAWLLSRGEVDYAVMQSDVAAAAFAGREPFDRGGPLGTLRAVGALFPEAVHILVLRDSRIRDVSGLKKQRVAVGQPASGSRFDAVAVLAAHDVQLSDLHEVVELPLEEAMERLRQKRTDAVFVTGSAPMRQLQAFAMNPGFRMLSIDADEISAIEHANKGLARITLPPNTYPQQRDPVTTVATVALLVTTVDSAAGEVDRVADALSKRLRYGPSVTIPVYPGLVARSQ